MAQIGVWNICYRPVLSITNIASVEYKFEVVCKTDRSEHLYG